MKKIKSKNFLNCFFILGFVLIFSFSIFAQKSALSDNSENKKNLQQINDFIKESFSKTYKSEEKFNYFDMRNKKEIETIRTYKGRLIYFEDCEISFFSSLETKVPKSESSEKVIFSLKNIDLNKIVFKMNKGIILINFYTKKKQIRQEMKSLSTFFGPGLDKYSHFIIKTHQYPISLKSDRSLEEIETALRNAIVICQEK